MLAFEFLYLFCKKVSYFYFNVADESVYFDVLNSERQEGEGGHLMFMGMIRMIWRKLLCHYMNT